MTLAEALTLACPNGQVLVTTGSTHATWFATPEGVTLVKLPGLGAGANSARDLRRQMLLQVHRAWAPQVLLVDQEPLGVADELDPILREAAARGLRTILGLRDIFARGESMPPEWNQPRVRSALAEQYDRVLVYGSSEVFDPRASYQLPESLSARLEFTGYIARNVPARPARDARAPRVLFSCGSGEDGAPFLETLLEALEHTRAAFETEIVLGPALPTARIHALRQRAAALDRVQVHASCSDVPELLARCDAVVATAGYHSAVEVLQSRLPALLCPRSFPNREQLVRAERLAALGLLRCLPQPTPEQLLPAVEELLSRGLSTRPLPSMDGCTRVVNVVQQLCSRPQRIETLLGQVQ